MARDYHRSFHDQHRTSQNYPSARSRRKVCEDLQALQGKKVHSKKWQRGLCECLLDSMGEQEEECDNQKNRSEKASENRCEKVSEKSSQHHGWKSREEQEKENRRKNL